MLELRLAGIHDDGENLVLESADGTSYLLPIDQNLRQSIAKARRISPLRTGGSGTFGPRDIQTRFRQGATVEEIAAESGWEPERVRRYEWPIVAERANIIQTARRVVISPTPGNKGAAQSLDQHIETVAHHHHFVDAPMDWSTWQQESGQWTVSVDIQLTDKATQSLPRGVMFPARWNFNPANQSIYASNEAAYFLMGRDNSKDRPIPAAATPEPAEEPTQEEPDAPRLTAVRVPENKEQNELLDELTARRGARSFDPASERKLADLLERARRSSRPAPAEGEVAETTEAGSQELQSADADVESAEVDAPQADASSEQAPAASESDQNEQVETAVQPVEGSESADSQAEPAETAAETYVADQEEAAESETTAPVTAATGDSAEADSPAADEEETQSTEPEATTSVTEAEETAVAPEETEVTETRAAARTNRGKRTSVPSWDDIIFGNQRR